MFLTSTLSPVSTLLLWYPYSAIDSLRYTYHYLNWFSKTSIIGWHEISRVRMVGIIVLWILAVGIYFVDYRIGFAVLLTLSLGHVILEFPLNH
jgi:hypothetical protein